MRTDYAVALAEASKKRFGGALFPSLNPEGSSSQGILPLANSRHGTNVSLAEGNNLVGKLGN
jgi:hypothetical protein